MCHGRKRRSGFQAHSTEFAEVMQNLVLMQDGSFRRPHESVSMFPVKGRWSLTRRVRVLICPLGMSLLICSELHSSPCVVGCSF